MADPDKAQMKWDTGSVSLVDNALEGSYPTLRTLWPKVAHAPDVLSFVSAGQTFKSMDEKTQRETFAAMAKELTFLGKGAVIHTDSGTRTDPARSVAYGDAVMMGERASKRAGMYVKDVGASSCGIFVRTLLKMIGAKCFLQRKEGVVETFSAEYASEAVFAEVEAVANANKHAAKGNPGDPEQAVNQDGPIKGADGQPVMWKKMPKQGDVVVIANDEMGEGHMFVIVEAQDVRGRGLQKVAATPGGPSNVLAFSSGYRVAQGGQYGGTTFPSDGSCMSTNESGWITLDATNWRWGKKKVLYWIDIHALAPSCDDDPVIKPVRNRWHP